MTEINRRVKAMFKAQWVNGDVDKFMASVKKRVKDAYGIDLHFKNQDDFLEQLIQHGLIDYIPKP